MLIGYFLDDYSLRETINLYPNSSLTFNFLIKLFKAIGYQQN